MAMKKAVCAYCGVHTDTECEHVVPESFALEELRDSCQWVCVRACSRCNRGFSADESDFRGFATVINALGDTLVKDAMFHGAVSRNWLRPEGKMAFERLFNMIRKPDGSGLSNREELLTVKNLGIVPDEHIIRAVRKIIRGLYFYHFTEQRRLPQVLPESQIGVLPIYDCSQERGSTCTALRLYIPSVQRCSSMHTWNATKGGWIFQASIRYGCLMDAKGQCSQLSLSRTRSHWYAVEGS